MARLATVLCISALLPFLSVSTSISRIQRLRREIRELNDTEWNMYATAVNRLYENGIVRSLAQKHSQLLREGIHGTPEFLPWHRAFLYEYEDALNEAFPEAMGQLAVPYWGWHLDAQNIHASPVFSTKRFGGFSQSQRGCISTGSFSNFRPCVLRGSGFRTPIWDEVDVTNCKSGRIGNQGFLSMAFCVEGLHNLVHREIGGYMETAFSPYDPIFYSHHAYVDKIWHEWQNQNTENLQAFVSASRAAADLVGFHMLKVRDVFQTFAYISKPNLESSPLAKDMSETLQVDLARIKRSCPAPTWTERDGENSELFPLTDSLLGSLEFSASRVDTSIQTNSTSCLADETKQTETHESNNPGINLRISHP